MNNLDYNEKEHSKKEDKRRKIEKWDDLDNNEKEQLRRYNRERN